MLDGSRVAGDVLPVVRDLAQRMGVGVLLMTSTFGGDGASPEELRDAEAGLGGVDVEHVVVDDRPAAQAAIELAQATDGGLICLSTHGRSGLGRAVLGSVADEVIRSGVVPALLIGPNCDSGSLAHAGPVALCIDGSDRSDRVLDEGMTWARSLGHDARMILVSNPFDGTTREESTELFDRLGRSHSVPDVELSGLDTVNGSVAWGLVTEAVKAPLMVISPATRTRWERLVLGSTTLSVIRNARCPVLVLAREPAQQGVGQGTS
jgi:nucleotide-binding universal stress UspA family protein